MNTVEFVKSLLKEKRVPLSRIEKDLGFANGYIGQLKKGTFPSDRLFKIAEYLGVSPEYLESCGGSIENAPSIPVLSSEESSFLILFRRLDALDRAQVVGYVNGLLAGDKYKKACSPAVGESEDRQVI